MENSSNALFNEFANLSVVFTIQNSQVVNNHSTTIEIDPKIIIYTTSFLIVLCTVSLTANVVILSSVCFMRSKVYPTLYFSLSLAAADTFSLFLFALGLVLFTLLPRGLGVNIEFPCVLLVIEAFRMGAILTTIFHLAALAGNHYLGILKPLRYSIVMTRSLVKHISLVLWTLPSALILMDIFIIEGVGVPSCSPDFLMKAKFRTTFAVPFYTTMGLMVFIYSHIYLLVNKYQKRPLRHVSARLQGNKTSFAKSQVNEKVIVTTLMILGSVVCGFMPAFTYFILCCEDCLLKHYWNKKTITEHFLLVLINFLMICKTATNSYIYACRMKELKEALRMLRRRTSKVVRRHRSSSGDLF